MKDRGQSSVVFQITVLVMLISVIVILGFRQYKRTQKTEMVVVAASNLVSGITLSPDQIRLEKVRDSQLPYNAVQDPNEVFGKQLVRDKQAGAQLLYNDFIRVMAPVKPLSDMVPEGRLLTTMLLNNLSLPHKNLYQGDRLDILASLAKDSKAARVMILDAYFMGYLNSAKPEKVVSRKDLLGDLDLSKIEGHGEDSAGKFALLFALKPEDMVTMAELNGRDSVITLVLHGRAEVASGKMLSVLPPEPEVNPEVEVKVKSVQLIRGEKTELITFE